MCIKTTDVDFWIQRGLIPITCCNVPTVEECYTLLFIPLEELYFASLYRTVGKKFNKFLFQFVAMKVYLTDTDNNYTRLAKFCLYSSKVNVKQSLKRP